VDNNTPVYATEHGDLRTSRPAAQPSTSLPPTQHIAVIQRTSKGRGGKVVTLVKNLHLSPDDHKGLTKHLKQTGGSGGTSKDGVIEIQGDHRETIAAALQHSGYKTKMAGGLDSVRHAEYARTTVHTQAIAAYESWRAISEVRHTWIPKSFIP
jgi:translation initiation factor 1